MMKRTDPDETALAEACAMVRRTWRNPMERMAATEKLFAASMIGIAAEDLDGIRAHMEILVQQRNEAREAFQRFKNTLVSCRDHIAKARNSQRWLTNKEPMAVPIHMVSEVANVELDEVIRRLVRALDKKTYYYLAELKGALCPLCGAKQ